ncbi:hypothetical protein TUSST3_45680 [Streptomyces sp. TUS-ST3]|uniref:hypothetical protein n=1 Tax=Streptomyces sp. TUS-ST3 TaxID=3025591 RepID=UPI00235B599A|nr:hypothetical protein [Streptomyces sp. TUS-ST3]GLP67946.1 hypothetical protein TUSST3_45680 [Streptomyces sp. TUS-ST3]
MTGEDATADRDGHGMGDERSGSAPDRRPAHSAKATGHRPEGPPPDRRRPHEDTVAGTTSAPRPPYGDGGLESLLGAAIRGGKSGGEAERRAVAAFRVARDAGAHRARTRRRDDWRPRAQRRRVRSLKATLSVLLASLTLGGVAYAAIGAGEGPAKGAAGDGSGRPSATTSAPVRSSSDARPSASASAPADRPATAKDTLAHCRSYEKLRGRGKALDSTAFRRLVAAAGTPANVSAYCAALTDTAAAGAGATNGTGATGATGEAKPGKRKGQASANPNADKNRSDQH